MCDPVVPARRRSVPIPRPRWGVLYAVVLLVVTVLIAAHLRAPGSARRTLDGGLAAAAVVAMALWVRGNRAALDQQAWCECAADTLTVRVIVSPRRVRPDAVRAPAGGPVNPAPATPQRRRLHGRRVHAPAKSTQT